MVHQNASQLRLLGFLYTSTCFINHEYHTATHASRDSLSKPSMHRIADLNDLMHLTKCCLFALLAEDPNNRTKYDAMVLCQNGMGAKCTAVRISACG